VHIGFVLSPPHHSKILIRYFHLLTDLFVDIGIRVLNDEILKMLRQDFDGLLIEELLRILLQLIFNPSFNSTCKAPSAEWFRKQTK
jgi:hypothetical protein